MPGGTGGSVGAKEAGNGALAGQDNPAHRESANELSVKKPDLRVHIRLAKLGLRNAPATLGMEIHALLAPGTLGHKKGAPQTVAAVAAAPELAAPGAAAVEGAAAPLVLVQVQGEVLHPRQAFA